MANIKNSFKGREFGIVSNGVQVSVSLESLNFVKVLMREMAMYYYACKLTSLASCRGSNNSRKVDDNACCNTSASSSAPTTSVGSESTVDCSYCMRYKHKTKSKSPAAAAESKQQQHTVNNLGKYDPHKSILGFQQQRLRWKLSFEPSIRTVCADFSQLLPLAEVQFDSNYFQKWEC
ncbi:hypothetical protein RUM43_001437 [Polyplax serrata]|uniref:Uncharacterized protein n=1 Tax=Polyplax serrata TaxID=468196 RepID=A0AAN8XS43_POLSC